MTRRPAIYPQIVNLELTNACNLACVFCDHMELKKTMPMGEMKTEVLENVLQDAARVSSPERRLAELGLVGLGEPTLDSKLPEHLALIGQYKDHFTEISLNSNLVSMTPDRADLLLDSCVNRYTFSVNASNATTYAELMGRDKFQTVVENLRTFLAKWKETSSQAGVAVQVFDGEGNDLDELVRQVPEANERVYFFVRKVYSKPILDDAETGLNVFASDAPKRYPCWDIYTRVYVDMEGNAYLCTIGNDCHRAPCGLCVGNVQDAPLSTLYNNDIAEAGRRRAEAGDDPYPECQTCNIWGLTPNQFDWNADSASWAMSCGATKLFTLKEHV